MAPANRREQRKRDTSERIAATAMRLFQEQGFDSVSVSAIAAEAGVTVPTFYAHFASKENVLISLPTREELAAVLARLPAELPLAERVRGAIRLWLRHFDTNMRQAVLDRWRIIAATPSLRVKAAEFERATAGLVLDALRHGPDEGTSRTQAQVAVPALMAAYTQILLRWAEEDGARELDVVASEVLDELRRAL
ncbi:TetR/AcrR family transcriptional regulator [Geodermatophilus sp. YIM 151500]|uniref:TetR/AcrR family transcriptional regulator n=1 Tax=Geodermatophilus sp. YIM 151500 TaxID=2984531 RepID=UPI0021E495AC|nr:TetR/AcrR family transcriptional regulator [Geodermatophilus sp. YIM 151500]MCV2491213.1 TetR/AcrR family transcriptional regulator [Geodermatophilus sp. YIM 151500]